jgi:hypothetical protein
MQDDQSKPLAGPAVRPMSMSPLWEAFQAQGKGKEILYSLEKLFCSRIIRVVVKENESREVKELGVCGQGQVSDTPTSTADHT